MLKVTVPRPFSDAVPRGGTQTAWQRGFDDDLAEQRFKPLTREQAEAFRQLHPQLSPWRVVAAQLVVGFVAASVAALVAGRAGAVSALYGAAVVAVPGALMARGATSRLTSLSPVVSAVGILGWGFVKMAASVLMLVLASRIVAGLLWPAMLTTMVICMQTYWFALLWRADKR